jgi:ureidoacrylate peracid hydrolase
MSIAQPSDDSFSAHRSERPMTFEPARSAVVVVDMINDFCKPGGAMVLPGYEALLGPQTAILEAARASGAGVVFVIDAHRPNVRQDREFLKRTPHCIEGTWGARVIDELAPRPDDQIVVKRRYSAFFNTDLDLTLKDMGVDTLVVMGVVTNICVRSTVHDAFFHGYRVAVPADACAATGPREQDSSLYDIATHFGLVATAQEIAVGLGQGAPVHNRIEA